jgi:sugar lactone lactonase YvrE
MANQNMLSALTYAGYEVAHAWGEGGGHDSKHASMIMADALVWLWKDYPAPVKTHLNKNARINVMLEEEQWTDIQTPNIVPLQLAVAPQGTVYFTAGQSVYRVDDKGTTLLAEVGGQTGGIAVASDGTVYVGDLSHRKVVSVDRSGSVRDVLKGKDAVHIEATPAGLYIANLDGIEYMSLQTKKAIIVHSGQIISGMALSADHNFLNVNSPNEVFGYSLHVLADGGIDAAQPYVHLHVPYGHPGPAALGMAVDRDNLLYTATAMGVQVSDQLGRVNFIFRSPGKVTSDVKLGGNNFDMLYIVCDGKLFKRRISAVGTYGWAPPVQPPKPGL